MRDFLKLPKVDRDLITLALSTAQATLERDAAAAEFPPGAEFPSLPGALVALELRQKAEAMQSLWVRLLRAPRD